MHGPVAHASAGSDVARRCRPTVPIRGMPSACRLPQWFCLLCAIAIATLPRSAHGQDSTHDLIEDTDCSCSIALRTVISLSDADHPGLFGYVPLLARDSRGRWYVSSTDDGTRAVGVFGVDGKLDEVLGREGGGPGEFRSIDFIAVGPGDTLWVYDNHLQRRTAFDADHKLVRIDRLPARVYDVFPVAGGRAVASANVRTPEHIGLPLHMLDPAGRILRSFGPSAAAYWPDLSYAMIQRIAGGPDGTIWAAPMNDYTVTAYTTTGEKVRSLRRTVPWFRPWHQPASSTARPGPYVLSIGFDSDDPALIWVILGVADPDVPEVRTPRMGRRTQEAIDSLYDTIIEAVDVMRGVVVASERFDHRYAGMADGLLPKLRVDETGNVWLDIVAPSIRRR